MACKIKALLRIRDGGNNVKKGATSTVSKGYADEWVERGWAQIVSEQPARSSDKKASK